MSFEDKLESLQRTLKLSGYELIREPVDISALVRDESVYDCEIIARKDFYNVLYMEARSNWRGIATDVAKKQLKPCLVITGYGKSHLILSTIKDYAMNPKPRHAVIDVNSKTHSFDDFARMIKVTQDDEIGSIDLLVSDAFGEFAAYKEALDEFADNLKTAIKNTRDSIVKASKGNKRYDEEVTKFLQMCHNVISEKLQPNDVTEMLLQHVLTYQIFSLIYDEQELHSTNAVARSLEEIAGTLDMDMKQMSAGYQTIKLIAESITDPTEKQDFLKLIYETFYAEYDPKNKDSWGIAYTPSEVVDFMVRSADWLLEKHFGKSISDDCVTLLDPATGTGTFVTSILRHLKPSSLETKYKNDIFANDISILAYYIAALNIENTYQEMTGKIAEFENICWMDTLATGTKNFGKISAYVESQDNVKRISRQQVKDICVVMGNPPYNAVQVSFNDANPANKYLDIDKKIEDTYVKRSMVGNKDKQYDMYKRFLKWASERIKNNGMVVFVSNNSFLDAKSDDGFRRSVYEEFDCIYTVNMKGNARLSGDAWKREGGKIFGQGARVGVAISFFIKTGKNHSEIQYAEVDNYVDREAKLKWLANNSLFTLDRLHIIPDEDAVWLNQTNNDFDRLIPIASQEEDSIFEALSMGIASNRNEWVYDFDEERLGRKIKYFISFYNKTLKKHNNKKPNINLKDWVDKKIKWTEDILKHIQRGKKLRYSNKNIRHILYRPFVSKPQYFDKIIIHRPRKFLNIFKNGKHNMLISFPNPKTNVSFQTLATDKIIDLDCVTGTQCIPLYMHDDNGDRHDNVTEYGLDLFQKYYKNNGITNTDIFYYIYAIFNDPKYSEKYKFNLQRELPRIPLAENFTKWVRIGKKLYDLHVNFDDAKPYALQRTDNKSDKNNTKLKLTTSDSKQKLSNIIIDEQTVLEGIPSSALAYKFGSKCALEWILEFYKDAKNTISDKSCDDPRIRNKFNTYRFADYKEQVIDLLMKVTTVSATTIKLRRDLENMPWGRQHDWRSMESKRSWMNKKMKSKNKTKKKSKKITGHQKKISGLQHTLDGANQNRLF